MDAYHLGNPNSSIGIFQRNMIAQLARNDGIDELYVLTTVEPDIDMKYDKCHYYIVGNSFVKKGISIARLNDEVKPDAIFYTFNLIPSFRSVKKTIKVLQNHDWSHGKSESYLDIKFKGHIYQIIHMRSSLKADLNIANSQFTNEETIKYSGRVCSVIYHDADPFYKNKKLPKTEIMEHTPLEPLKYIIYAGRVNPTYKNIHSLLMAFDSIITQYKGVKLVIVHSDFFNNKDRGLLRRLGSKVISLRNVSKLELKYLYQNSLCMVYPSIYEGFGSPILEAQNSETPVIAYDSRPMTEVGGNGAIYFNGTINDLTEKIKLFIEDSSIRKNRISMGLKNANRFDWKITAKKTVETIDGQRC